MLRRTFQTVFEVLREDKKLDQVFEKLGRMFVLQRGSCCPNQPQYMANTDKVLAKDFRRQKQPFADVFQDGSIPLNITIFKNNFSTYFGYVENVGVIYFAHKCIYLLQKNVSFR